MRGLASRSEGFGGWAGLGPVDKSERLGAVLDWASSVKMNRWRAGLARAGQKK